jgi:hypothetical protein
MLLLEKEKYVKYSIMAGFMVILSHIYLLAT